MPQHHVAELGLGQQQEVVRAAPPDDERRDDARLCGQQKRLAARSCATSFDTIRCRKSSASGPRTATYERGRMADAFHLASVGSVPLFRSRAEKKVVDAGFDPARLPPGQYLTDKWPVLHAGSVPETDLATWDFRVWGQVERELVALVGGVQRRCRRSR